MRRKVVTEAKQKGSDIVICGDAHIWIVRVQCNERSIYVDGLKQQENIYDGDKREVSYFKQHLTISFDLIDI